MYQPGEGSYGAPGVGFSDAGPGSGMPGAPGSGVGGLDVGGGVY